MAVENVNNALKHFEADKNLFDKLDEKEKSELSKVEKKDCQAAKNTLGGKMVNGVKLSELMKTFEYNVKQVNGRNVYESFVTINGAKKRIDTRSDLGALIQMYALANGVANVGSTGIDGSIGEKTITGLNQAKLIPEKGNNGNKKEMVDNNEGEKMSLNELLTKSLKKYIKPESNVRIFQLRSIIDDGFSLTPTNKATYKTEKKLKFTYSYRGRAVNLNVPFTLDNDGNVDPQKVMDDIREACVKEDKQIDINLNNSTAKTGIDKFKEKNDITDNLIKDRAEDKNIDFEAYTYNNGRIMITDKNGGKLSATMKNGGFMMNNTDVITNGQFDSVKFNKILSTKCRDVAVAYEKADLTTATTAAKGESSISKRIEGFKSVLKEIASFGPAYQKDLAAEKIEAAKWREYYEVVQNINKAKTIIDDPKKTRAEKIDALDDVVIVKAGNVGGVNIKVIDYNNKWRTKYAAVDKKTEYNSTISSLVRKIFGNNLEGCKEVNK